MCMNSRFKGTINSMFIHYLLIFLLTFTTAIVPATTDASAEAYPFGASQTYLRKTDYKTYHSVYNSEYKYISDIPKNNEVIVAVIDDHISSSYVGLENQFWVNEAEKNGSPNFDDDENGYVDDVHGWDFDGDQPLDGNNSSSHGNYVTGMIAGTLQEDSNGFMVRGVNPDVKIMRIYMGPTILSATEEAEAIHYAVDNGARVINLSHAQYDSGTTLSDAIEYAKSNNVFIIVAGSNERIPSSIEMETFDDVYAVGRMSYSPDTQDVYGKSGVMHDKIDYCLPQKMRSLTVSSGLYGTSYAAPVLSAIISRLLMYNNTLTDAEVRTILDENSIITTGTDENGSYTCKRPSPELIYKNWYGGQINRKSVKVQNHDGTKSAIFNIETVIDASNNLVRREVRHVNSGKTRYWFSEEIEQ